MKITLLQTDIVWADPKANIDKADKLIDLAPHSQIYVLPEMWSTGFVTRPTDHLQAFEGEEALSFMRETARRKDAAVAGSVAVRATDGSFRNRFYFVKPDGEVTYYDKHHLFTYSGEHLRYAPGSERVTVEWLGVRFRLLVCYDLRFPLWSRNESGEGGYDVALYVASWPTPRVQAWKKLLLARAIENQCYVVGVNRVGVDPSCHYSGGTMLVDPYGEVSAQCPDGEVSSVSADIDLDALRQFREKFPVLEDQDY